MYSCKRLSSTQRLGITLIATALIGAVLGFHGPVLKEWRLNRTPSLPIGLYRAQHESAIVSFCLHEPWAEVALRRGYREQAQGDNCPDNGEPLLKRVVGRSGDTVEETGQGVWINGVRQQSSTPLRLDGKTRVLQPYLSGSYTLSGDELWVMGEHPKSFDSRYYGPIHESDVRGHWEAVYVWH